MYIIIQIDIYFLDLGSGCDESITVWRVNPGFGLPTPNFAPYVGKYYYYGNTVDGYPRYVHQASGSEISLSVLNNNLVVTYFTDYDILYSTATTTDEGVVEELGNNRWGIIDTFFSPPGTDMSRSTTNNDQIPLENPDWRDDLDNPVSVFWMIATFSDCPYYGLEVVSSTPPIRNQCPSYDSTEYSDCGGDTHCANCQAWGCAQCENGYYKMGNLQRCQSCIDNYPNCQQCSDWNGCVTCDDGFQVVWDGDCKDEVCQ